MNIHELESITQTAKKRGGQGHGSGRGKTAGRGQKGQKARNKIPLRFEGGALALTKRLPFLRGKGKHKSFRKRPVVLNISLFNALPKDAVVDIALLVKHKLVKEGEAKAFGVKILGDGELQQSLQVKLPVTKGAKEKIEKAGGTVN